ncbi:MAG: OmpA family protein [Spirochaetes bacterium]|jgi:outer membrane protein OmpA-like peptidoglycan-associated protein|nr:OmpA family protein [Spirochaetota bacterium]
MKKIIGIIFAAVMVFTLACTSEQKVKDQPNVTAGADVFVGASNDQLSKYPIAGFGYKSAALPKQSWDKWAKVASPVVKEILDKMPEGYVLQVTGHTDGRGPESPEGKKPGNVKISSDRAKTVYGSLVKSGIESKNLTYKGVGSNEPLSGVDPKDPEQRRVTFQVVPK